MAKVGIYYEEDNFTDYAMCIICGSYGGTIGAASPRGYTVYCGYYGGRWHYTSNFTTWYANVSSANACGLDGITYYKIA